MYMCIYIYIYIGKHVYMMIYQRPAPNRNTHSIFVQAIGWPGAAP